MTEYMYKNIGSSQTVIGTSPQTALTSELNWHTEYDGNKATVLTETIENGKTNYNELSFTNKELADIGGIVNIPKHLDSIDVRLIQDYPTIAGNNQDEDDVPFHHNVGLSGGRRKNKRSRKKTNSNSKSKSKKTKTKTKTKKIRTSRYKRRR